MTAAEPATPHPTPSILRASPAVGNAQAGEVLKLLFLLLLPISQLLSIKEIHKQRPQLFGKTSHLEKTE